MNRKERRVAASQQKQAPRMQPASAQDVHALLMQGIALHQQNRLKDAEAMYKRILELQPEHKDAKHLLGVAAYRQGRVDQGIGLLKEVLEHEPRFAEGYSNLGNMYMAKGELPQALEALKKCLELKPGYADGYNNLGNAQKLSGHLEAAVENYRKAMDLAPNSPDAYCNLGVVYQEIGLLDKAVEMLKKAIELNPDFAEAYNNLGITYQLYHKFKEAKESYQRAIGIRPGYADAYSNLGNLHKELREFDEAVAALQKAIEIKPFFSDAYGNLALVRRDQGKIEDARAAYRKALAIAPNPAFALREALLVAPVPSSEEEIRKFRDGVETKIDMLRMKSGSIADPLRTVGGTGFFLAYHGENDKSLQERIAQFFLKQTPSLDWTSPQVKRWEAVTPLPRIRVAIASAFLYDHTIGKLMAGLIEHLPKDTFEIVLVRLGVIQDEYSKRLDAAADRVVYVQRHIDFAREQIAQEEADILLYPDVGMDPLSYFLAFARLAPIQCAMWGHPDTTGVPNVDYFISSAQIEPENAQDHYSERLIRLKELPCYAYKPQVKQESKYSRAFFKLPETGRLYLCPQSLFKLHPKYDATLAALLRRDPEGSLVLIEGYYPSWTEAIRQRFAASFPDVADRVVFIPRVKGEDFPALLTFADALLDPPAFGGGQTSYESLGLGMPIVTWPGEYMRGRVTLGCYRTLGIDDLIARSDEEYVALAHRLATDRPWRESLQERIHSASSALFENPAVIQEFTRFLTEAVAAARKRERVSGW